MYIISCRGLFIAFLLCSSMPAPIPPPRRLALMGVSPVAAEKRKKKEDEKEKKKRHEAQKKEGVAYRPQPPE